MDITAEFIYGLNFGLEVIFVEPEDYREVEATHVISLSLGIIRILAFIG